MKTSNLITYLQNEVRKHGDCEVRLCVDGQPTSNNLMVVTKHKTTWIEEYKEDFE